VRTAGCAGLDRSLLRVYGLRGTGGDVITKLKIERFKSIRALALDCRRINLFIGEPNVGKSNILDALGLLSWCGSQGRSLKQFVWQGSTSDWWWYRNIVGPSNFSIQGYKRHRIYPDFVVQRQKAQREMPFATVVVVESKGKHLRETLDSRYKR
jgi:predicted ATP-dependent endonuclease of OLD family